MPVAPARHADEDDDDDSSDDDDGGVLMGMSPDVASGPGGHMAGHYLRGMQAASHSRFASHR